MELLVSHLITWAMDCASVETTVNHDFLKDEHVFKGTPGHAAIYKLAIRSR